MDRVEVWADEQAKKAYYHIEDYRNLVEEHFWQLEESQVAEIILVVYIL